MASSSRTRDVKFQSLLRDADNQIPFFDTIHRALCGLLDLIGGLSLGRDCEKEGSDGAVLGTIIIGS